MIASKSWYTFLLVILIFSLSSKINSQEIRERIEKVISEEFEKKVFIDYEKYILPVKLKQKIENKARQRFFGEFVYILRIYNNEKLEAAALLDNVPGKELPITFIVIFNRDGKIRLTDVVKYREPYGGAVQSEAWTSQFKGKDNISGYKIGKDIDGITGATISVKSVTAGVHKLSLLYHEIKDSLWTLSYTDLINR